MEFIIMKYNEFAEVSHVCYMHILVDNVYPVLFIYIVSTLNLSRSCGRCPKTKTVSMIEDAVTILVVK